MKKLVLVLRNEDQLQKVLSHFAARSDFYPDSYDSNNYKITFEDESDNLSSLEEGIDDELTEYGFTGYWFERQGEEEQVIIDANREGYGTDQVRRTMTVRELIDYLEQFSEDAKVYLSHDNGYTYGGITESCFH